MCECECVWKYAWEFAQSIGYVFRNFSVYVYMCVCMHACFKIDLYVAHVVGHFSTNISTICIPINIDIHTSTYMCTIYAYTYTYIHKFSRLFACI